MGRIAIQIYEIQAPREAETIIELGVDRIGSVLLSEDDWKVPSIREAILVSKAAAVKHSLIPLFNSKEVLLAAMDYYHPDIVHFCESLTFGDGRMMPYEALLELQFFFREQFPQIEVMRSVPISPPNSVKKISTLEIAGFFEKATHCFLTDTWFGQEPVQGYIGITGRICDWDIARKLVESSAIPVILAGGLSPENVYEGVMAVRPFGVDSCTGTNAKGSGEKMIRFKKDFEKVKAFVAEVRRAEEDLSACSRISEERMLNDRTRGYPRIYDG